MSTATTVTLTDVYGEDVTVELDMYHETVKLHLPTPSFTSGASRYLDSDQARSLAAQLTAFADMVDAAS